MKKWLFLSEPDYHLALFAFFLANVSAFFFPFWLSPRVVMFQAVLWVVLSAVLIWRLHNQNLLGDFYKKMFEIRYLLPFVIFTALSFFWSVEKSITLSRMLVFVGTILSAGYIGVKYGLQKFLRLLSIFGALNLFFNGLCIFLFPQIGIMNYYIIQGAWKGFYWHKNHLGLLASFFNLIFLIELLYSLRRSIVERFLWVFLFFVSFVFILGSDSAAALMTSLFLYGLVVILMLWVRLKERLTRLHYLLILIFSFFLILIMFTQLDSIFAIFNRNTSLTGRVPMWGFLFEEYFSQKPHFGYGFNAFWYIEEHRVSTQIAAGYPDPIVIADNGFIDLLMNNGWFGFGLFLFFYLVVWQRVVVFAAKARDVLFVFPVLVMAFILAANITWSVLFENESFFMLVMIGLMIILPKALNEVHMTN